MTSAASYDGAPRGREASRRNRSPLLALVVVFGLLTPTATGCSIVFHDQVSLSKSVKKGKCPKLWPMLTDLGLMIASVSPLFIFDDAGTKLLVSLPPVLLFGTSAIVGATSSTRGGTTSCREVRR